MSDPFNEQRSVPTDLDVYGVPYGPPPAQPEHPAGDIEVPTPTGGPRWQRFRRLIRNRGALIAIAFLTIVGLAAIFAPLVVPHDPNQLNNTLTGLPDRFAGPSWSHPLGTDYLGRDELSRLIFGARVSLFVAYAVVAISLAIALPIGLLSGYFGGLIDNLLMRLTDVGMSFPPLVLALAIAGILGPSVTHTILALLVYFTPGFIQFTRGQALGVSQETYVEASRAIGTHTWRILYGRVLPNVRSPLTVTVTLSIGGALLAEAGLSFLGLGVRPPTPSWGNMLLDGYNNGIYTHPWTVIIPAMAIFLTVLAYNTLGDGIRRA